MEKQKGSSNSCTHLLCTSCLTNSINTNLHELSSMQCEDCDAIVVPEMYRDIISYDVFIKWVHARLAGDLKGKKKPKEKEPAEEEEREKENDWTPKGKKKGILVLPRVRISSRQHRSSKNTVVIPFSIGSASFSFHISIRPQALANSRRQVKKEKIQSRRVFTTFETGESSKSIPIPVPVSVPADENFYCIICMDDKPIDEMFWVSPCSHFFCTACIIDYITAKVEENILSIGCPDPECKSGILDPDNLKDILPDSVFSRWTYALMESSLGLTKFYCPFSDCSQLMIADENSTNITCSECPHCNRMFCAKCKVPWHGDISCEEFAALGLDERGKEDLMLRSLAKNSKWQRCPQCHMYVERVDGCKFMNCRCGYCFCYVCGSQMSKSNHNCTCSGS